MAVVGGVICGGYGPPCAHARITATLLPPGFKFMIIEAFPDEPHHQRCQCWCRPMADDNYEDGRVMLWHVPFRYVGAYGDGFVNRDGFWGEVLDSWPQGYRCIG